ncbi:MAG: STAS domain-containing protein [Anaerolineales bacterium]|nr:STAS domain-containing protein [Anaerolineales bacterium]
MWILPKNLADANPVLAALKPAPHFFLRPVRIFQDYRRAYLQPDLIAGLTVSVVLLPQAIVFAILAGLPPQMGLYSAIIAAIVGALWGSSNYLHSGPTNTASILVLSTLAPLAVPGSPDFITAAGLLAVMVGVFRLGMGLARLGLLVTFVSDSVIIGFTAGAGVLIAVGELRSLLRLESSAQPGLLNTLENVFTQLSDTHFFSLALGVGTLAVILLLRHFYPKWPGPLIALTLAGTVVALFGLDQRGVEIIGELPRSLPPLAQLPLTNVELIGQLSVGALAVAAIGLVEATSIARSFAAQSGQRLDNNQEFIGQGLANIACGFLSGHACSGSFNRSALNYEAKAQTPLASVFSGLFVLVAMFLLSSLAAYIPRTSLAAMLILAAYGMIDRREMARLWRGARSDAVIMLVTLLATLFLPLQFAVLAGILMSLAYYILKTSTPRVIPVLPDETFKHFAYLPNKPQCPQLGIIKISGDLYFGAVNHVEEAIRRNMARHPRQRFLLLRMHGINHCDISGIHMLESILRACRERGGDLFLMKVQSPIYALMEATGFCDQVGRDHFLPEDYAIEYLFHRVLDPAICIYECEVRAFKECQNLPKRIGAETIPLPAFTPLNGVADIAPQDLWRELMHSETPPLVVDVREPREFQQGHIPQAQLIPLLDLASKKTDLPHDREIVLVCRSGRRSQRAACLLKEKNGSKVRVLKGGMLAWEAAKLLEAVDR